MAFDEDAAVALALSVRAHGTLTPLTDGLTEDADAALALSALHILCEANSPEFLQMVLDALSP